MTAAGIIEQYNTERPNSIDDFEKLEWLEKCEQMIIDIVIRNHQGCPEDDELTAHIESFGMDTEMYVPQPYDDLYLDYIDQRAAINNNDTKRYNTASQLYNNALLTYQQKYNREHMANRSRNRMYRHEDL